MSEEINQKLTTAQILEHNLQPLYFNGFGLGGGATDITITLLNSNSQVGTIQASPSVLKELARSLVASIEIMEQATGMQYPTLSDLMNKIQEGQNDA